MSKPAKMTAAKPAASTPPAIVSRTPGGRVTMTVPLPKGKRS